jgi:hypothetical protein
VTGRESPGSQGKGEVFQLPFHSYGGGLPNVGTGYRFLAAWGNDISLTVGQHSCWQEWFFNWNHEGNRKIRLEMENSIQNLPGYNDVYPECSGQCFLTTFKCQYSGSSLAAGWWSSCFWVLMQWETRFPLQPFSALGISPLVLLWQWEHVFWFSLGAVKGYWGKCGPAVIFCPSSQGLFVSRVCRWDGAAKRWLRIKRSVLSEWNHYTCRPWAPDA